MDARASGRPRPYTVGWVLHGLGIVGLITVVLLLLSWGTPRIAYRRTDWIVIAALIGASLLLLGFSSLIGFALGARRRWAAGLALARALLAILFVIALVIALPLLVILPMVGVLLIGPWLAAFVGEILLCVGGFMAFARRHRAGTSSTPA
jgi:hypothetical protein